MNNKDFSLILTTISKSTRAEKIILIRYLSAELLEEEQITKGL